MDGVNEGFYHGMMLGLCAVLEIVIGFVPTGNQDLDVSIFS